MNESYREAIRFVTEVITDLAEENERLTRQLAGTSAPSNRKKLSPREVATVRDMHRFGHTQSEIAAVFDVNRATISRTVRGIYH